MRGITKSNTFDHCPCPQRQPNFQFLAKMDTYRLDEIDIKILNLLQEDGTLSHAQLARKIHKSYNPTSERVARLKKLGYIQKLVALVDLEKAGSVFTAFPMIQLKNHSEQTFRDFQQEIASYPQILECHHLMGDFDFILKIVLPDITAYNTFLRNHISTLDCVLRVVSFPVLSQIKRETAYELKLSR